MAHPKFRLRRLLIALAILPPSLAVGYWGWGKYVEWRDREQMRDEPFVPVTPDLVEILREDRERGGLALQLPTMTPEQEQERELIEFMAKEAELERQKQRPSTAREF